MAGNKTLVAMKRADGTMDSIVHLPDATSIMETIGIERVPARCTLPWRGGGGGLGIGT